MYSGKKHSLGPLLIGVFIFCWIPIIFLPELSLAQSQKNRLKSIDINRLETGIVITIQTDYEIKNYKQFTLDDPPRIVFDFFGVISPYEKEQSLPVDAPGLKRVRHYGDPKRLRVVLDTEARYLTTYSYEAVENGLEIKIGAEPKKTAEKPEVTPPKPEPVPVPPQKEQQPREIAQAPATESTEKKDATLYEKSKTDDIDALTIVGEKLDFLMQDEPAKKFTLESTIRTAVKVNIGLKISHEDVNAAQATKKEQQTNFYPTFSADYRFRRNDEGPSIGGFASGSANRYDFSTTISQPVFTGFSIINQYEIANLGLNVSKINERIRRQDIILEANTAYFNLLKAQKLHTIARQTVDQIAAQREVAKNFYEVGMSPLNDFLQSEVELANAKQDLVIAGNDLETARSLFNTLLRRSINSHAELEDILTYKPFEYKLDWCQDAAEKNRLEIKLADLEVKIAEKEVDLSERDFFPSIALEGTYFRAGTDFAVNGGAGIFDPDGWFVGAVATWDFWQWGRTMYGKKEKLSRLSQSEHRKEDLLDQIQLEVKEAYLNNLENEVNILTLQKAVEQAEENYRIFQERYKEQVTTSTDVLIAQTLLARTQVNFYSALYDFKISKAALYRAMGLEYYE